MSVDTQIQEYLAGLAQPKQQEMQVLHEQICALVPGVRLWFHDGRNEAGKVVSHPNIGYGLQTIRYANGTHLDWFKVGISAHTTGISVYLPGIKDKHFLKEHYGDTLGKASISGYCIKFRKLADINRPVLNEAIRRHLQGE